MFPRNDSPEPVYQLPFGSRTVMYREPLVVSLNEVGGDDLQLAAPLTFSVKPAISYI